MRHRTDSRETYERFCAVLKTAKVSVAAAETFETWKQNAVSSKATIEAQCQRCGVFAQPRIANFLRNPVVACFCTGRLKVRSQEFQLNLRKKLDSTNLVILSSLDAIHNNSPIDIRCNLCGVVAKSCIRNLLRALTIDCACHSTYALATPIGFDRICQDIESSRFVWTNRPTLEDWVQTNPTARSRINLTCKTCADCVAPMIYAFRNGHVGCGCDNSNEFLVVRHVRKIVASFLPDKNIRVVRQYRSTNLRGLGGKPLSFDIAVFCDTDPFLFIEVDGGHHFFDDVYSYQGQELRHHKEHDLLKERFAMSIKVPMLRLCVQTVASKQKWPEWMQACVLEAMKGALVVGIHRMSAYSSYNRSPFYKPMRMFDPLLADAKSPVLEGTALLVDNL